MGNIKWQETLLNCQVLYQIERTFEVDQDDVVLDRCLARMQKLYPGPYTLAWGFDEVTRGMRLMMQFADDKQELIWMVKFS